MGRWLQSFLGDTPGRVLVKLLIFSLIIGALLNFFGWTPVNVFERLWDTLVHLWHSGFSSASQLFSVIFVGAAVVVPIFIIIRILSLRK
ncbi:DUF6460 domain-containing protein [Bartonella sp. HY329]|uniref:DUF6460 domain-containing protein n=1 Tax=unclassified Bartonella TaxID=2645622 RepID=UPI0021C7C488|nr:MULTISPECIES: DUF6460 domain-containing protein [unclassified Bartonella]UXM95388.1 DUF6460 domain-containing protein [Bartonella sp. HY329]UXN09713.1 DUF6460 domain-containing protein [Bartonella sp. HY328]